MLNKSLKFRKEAQPSDMEAVREIAESTGFFYPDEVDVAVELVEERLKNGDASDYYFVFAEIENKVVAYTCFGPIPVTKGSFDLYWIITHNDFRGLGIGKKLLAETYTDAKKLGARAIYAETSGREKYEPTRQFYLKTNYTVDAVQKDFYDVGDDKYVFKFALTGEN